MIRAGLLRNVLWLAAIIATARGIGYLVAAVLAGTSDAGAARSVPRILDLAGLLTILLLISAVVAWLAWIAWTSRLEQNAVALGAGEGSIGPRGAILWWLVPFANLLVPFGQILGLDRRLGTGERQHDVLIAAWWITFLAGVAALFVTVVTLGPDPASAGIGGREAMLAAGVASLIWAAALVLSIRVVRQVQRDENARAALTRGIGARGTADGSTSVPGGWVGSSPASTAVPGWPSPNSAGTGRSIRISGVPVTVPSSTPFGGLWRQIAPAIGVAGIVAVVGVAIGLASSDDSRPPRVTAPPVTAPSPTGPGVTGRPGSPTPIASNRTAPPSGEPTPVPTPTVAPSGGALVLLAHLAIGDGDCGATAPENLPTNAIAAVDCRPENQSVAALQYALYDSLAATQTAYEADLTAADVARASGDCFHGKPGETGFGTNQATRGRVFCYVSGKGDQQTPTYEWYDATLFIVGRATGATGTAGDLGALGDWFVKESGPV